MVYILPYSYLIVWVSHRSSRFVVVQVHLLPQGPATLSRVHELSGELVAEANVVGAAAPLPVSDAGGGDGPRVGVGAAAGLMAVVARAGLYAALAAGACNRVRHRRTRDGVDERCLSTTCNKPHQ